MGLVGEICLQLVATRLGWGSFEGAGSGDGVDRWASGYGFGSLSCGAYGGSGNVAGRASRMVVSVVFRVGGVGGFGFEQLS